MYKKILHILTPFLIFISTSTVVFAEVEMRKTVSISYIIVTDVGGGSYAAHVVKRNIHKYIDVDISENLKSTLRMLVGMTNEWVCEERSSYSIDRDAMLLLGITLGGKLVFQGGCKTQLGES